MTQLENLIDTYCSAWNEPDVQRRDAIIASIWHTDATYTDPGVHAAGRQELSDHIGRILTRRVGAKVIRTSNIDDHHDVVRFNWKVVMPDGSILRHGIDFGEISADGMIRRIIGFFGDLTQE